MPFVKADAKTISEAFEQFSDEKTNFITIITEAFTYDTNAAFSILSLLPLVTVDLDMLPVTLLGSGEESIAFGIGFLGAKDVKSGENKNGYFVSHSNDEGVSYMMDIVYDAKSDELLCTSLKDGNENIYVQYQKTSFGYIAQYYLTYDDGESRLFQLSLSGEDGIVGVSRNVDKPVALSGDENYDFPKTNSEWYAITGNTVTGLTSDGIDLNFDYTPKPSEP